MSNEVSTKVFGGGISVKDMASLAQRAQSAAQNNPRGGAPNGSDYMNFSGKQGRFTIGQEKREIYPDELWLVDVLSFEEGWVCWKGGQSPSSRMANIYNGVPVEQPDPEELGPFDRSKGDGWYQAKAMVLKSGDNGQQGYLKINSISGVSEMAELMGSFSERAATGAPCWPVVRLEKEQFESQGFKNFKPKFNVVAWLTNDQIEELADGADLDDVLEEAEGYAPPAPAASAPRGRARK